MENYEKRVSALLAEYADLLNQEYPADKTHKFWAKVSELPEEYQAEVRRLADVTRNLKRSLEARAR